VDRTTDDALSEFAENLFFRKSVRRTSEVRSTRAPYVRSGEMGSLRGSAAARTLLQADKNEPPTVVGVNINIPIPVISDLLGSETPHKDRYVRVFRS